MKRNSVPKELGTGTWFKLFREFLSGQPQLTAVSLDEVDVLSILVIVTLGHNVLS